MVVPWIGFELGKLLKLVEPTSNARYVAFQTLYAPDQMPGQEDRFIGGGLKYPYVEGLRLDEAMHPLAFMTQGYMAKPCHRKMVLRCGLSRRGNMALKG